MMSKKLKNDVIVGGAVFSVLILLVACLIVALVFPGLKSEVRAAWVQAVGSIGAIFGAFVLATMQSRRTERKREYEIKAARATIAAGARHHGKHTFFCLDSIQKKLETAFQGGAYLHIGIDRLEDIQIALRSFAAKDIPPRLLAEILILQREVAYTLTAIHECNRLENVTETRLAKANRRIKKVVACRQRMFQLYRGYAAEARKVT